MIMVDTSTWIEFLEGRFDEMRDELLRDQVLMHPWVLGEILLGMVPQRRQFLRDCAGINPAPVIEDQQVIDLIEAEKLYGTGLGWVDCQLLASAKAMEANLWTHDKALKKAWDKVKRG